MSSGQASRSPSFPQADCETWPWSPISSSPRLAPVTASTGNRSQASACGGTVTLEGREWSKEPGGPCSRMSHTYSPGVHPLNSHCVKLGSAPAKDPEIDQLCLNCDTASGRPITTKNDRAREPPRGAGFLSSWSHVLRRRMTLLSGWSGHPTSSKRRILQGSEAPPADRGGISGSCPVGRGCRGRSSHMRLPMFAPTVPAV